jgi:hypothetical protein
VTTKLATTTSLNLMTRKTASLTEGSVVWSALSCVSNTGWLMAYDTAELADSLGASESDQKEVLQHAILFRPGHVYDGPDMYLHLSASVLICSPGLPKYHPTTGKPWTTTVAKRAQLSPVKDYHDLVTESGEDTTSVTNLVWKLPRGARSGEDIILTSIDGSNDSSFMEGVVVSVVGNFDEVHSALSDVCKFTLTNEVGPLKDEEWNPEKWAEHIKANGLSDTLMYRYYSMFNVDDNATSSIGFLNKLTTNQKRAAVGVASVVVGTTVGVGAKVAYDKYSKGSE